MRIDCFVLSAGSGHSKIRSNGGRRSSGRQFESMRFASRDYLCCGSVVKKSSSRAAAVDDLSPVLDQISIKNKKGAESSVRPKMLEDEFERKPKDLILNVRKRLVKKSTIVDSESAASLDPACPSPSVDYSSADDGDVDSPVSSKVKTKLMQASVSPKPFPSSTKLHRSSDAGDEHVYAPGFETRAKGSTIKSSCAIFNLLHISC
jgi:hypothetical protein